MNSRPHLADCDPHEGQGIGLPVVRHSRGGAPVLSEGMHVM